MDQPLANLTHFVTALSRTLLRPGRGRWTRQERPDEVSAAIIDFTRSLPNWEHRDKRHGIDGVLQNQA